MIRCRGCGLSYGLRGFPSTLNLFCGIFTKRTVSSTCHPASLNSFASSISRMCWVPMSNSANCVIFSMWYMVLIGPKCPCLRLVGELVVIMPPLVVPPMPVTSCGLIHTPVHSMLLRSRAITRAFLVLIETILRLVLSSFQTPESIFEFREQQNPCPWYLSLLKLSQSLCLNLRLLWLMSLPLYPTLMQP